MFFVYTTNCKNLIIKNIDPKMIRLDIFNEVNKNYKYLSYKKSKEIFHEKINMIDIYGNIDDNTCTRTLEHIFPQSFFKHDENRKYMKSDLHNLYLCNNKLNTYRQNFKYIDPKEIKDKQVTSNDKILDINGNVINDLKISNIFNNNGYLMVSNKKSNTFIPTEYSKGKISRSLSYFSIKYNFTDILSKIIDPLTLLKWNYDDPVDNNEFLKNIISYRYQNNYNPFILNTDLVLYSFLDLYDFKQNEDLINDIIANKKTKQINPIPSINFLIDEINQIENECDSKKLLDLKNKIDLFLKK